MSLLIYNKIDLKTKTLNVGEMFLTVKYTFEVNRLPGVKETFTLKVPNTENLVKFGYDYLHRGMLREKEDVPSYLVYDKYALVNIKVLEEPCEGCKWDCPAQRDNMECHGGCLHDKKDCMSC